MRSHRNLPVLAVSKSAPAIYTASSEVPPPQDFASAGLSLQQVLAILRAYKLQMLMIVLAISLLMGGLIKLMPKTYIATATVMFSPEGNDPLASNQASATPLFNYMSTESQLMLSPEVLLAVIDKLNLTQDEDYAAGYAGDGSGLRDWVRENLVKSLDIQLGAFGSQLIYVNASARTPALAAQIANTLTDVYLDQQRRRMSGPASERAKRYVAELAELKDKVRIAQDQVNAFRQRTGVTDTTQKNISTQQTLLATLEASLQDAQNARRAAEVKAAAEHNSTSVAGSAAVQNLKALLNTQQLQLAQLRTVYGAEHPKVRELDNQIRATQHSLSTELQSASSTNSSDLIAAQQLEAKMRAAVEEQRAKVLGVNKVEGEGSKFELELESAQSVYKRALDAYDTIMLGSGGSIANITVVSAAVPPQKSAKPNKMRLLLLGMLGGLAVGVAVPLAYELLLDRRIRCRDDFERDFDLPVLMEFDPIKPLRGAL
ncbi:MAG: Wzz/FepE/Etk N-terminal domain-containing protein [Pseudomonadota bacterium]|nr:Wzz/FepE/Etk N-terminal domain-containing protein [Pseudomonadota bacterium]